jgi:type IX secretion system PorP/SprF family membrane protein
METLKNTWIIKTNNYLSHRLSTINTGKRVAKHLRPMKKTLTTLAFAVFALTASAQQDPQFTQFMFNKMFMNPGYAGIRHALCFSGIARQQWAGFDGSPQSGVFSGDMFLPKLKGGVALNVMYDKLGFEQNMAYRAAYSFHVPIKGGYENGGSTLGIGLELGALSKRVGPTGSDQWLATTNWQQDGSIPPQIKKTNFDLGFGIWFQRQNMWFGASSTHLPASTIDDGSITIGNPLVAHSLAYKVARHYFLTGGMNFPLGNWELRPSFLVKSDATVTQFDINALMVYNNQFWGGLSYRFQDAVCPMIGFQKQMGDNPDAGLKIGFAYDFTTSRLNDYNNGSFELFVNYCIPIVVKTVREGHGSVRIFD